jgi:hypothetical protein
LHQGSALRLERDFEEALFIDIRHVEVAGVVDGRAACGGRVEKQLHPLT